MCAYFSPSVLAIYPEELKSSYQDAGSFPDDCVKIDDNVAKEFHPTKQPAGKILGELNGMPAWVEVPPLTHDEQVVLAENEKQQFRDTADSKIAWLQDAVDIEIATDAEKTLLTEWKKYRVMLMRVDTSHAPNINWPVAPE